MESHHQPTLRDVIAVTRETRDMRILDSLNRLFDRAAYDVTPGAASDAALRSGQCAYPSDLDYGCSTTAYGPRSGQCAYPSDLD